MRYLTHQFAHVETLERARRWLLQAGFDPSQIEAVAEGIPRISVRLKPGQASAVEQIIDAAELSDPEGLPSFWELARQEHVHGHIGVEPESVEESSTASQTFVVGYRVPNERPDLGVTSAEAAMRDAYNDRQWR